ncbi:CPBP family intramembrane glutamic endopeptidase [Sphingomonas soli]|uniref:CPBP family intramembrane glutamic endopeptidase n=1 Tax=Sphingomonas soli TaxID=266127 RepID=UPI00082E855C|nr:CPBP family intramembrane glutamic endopeptidase [Sphingomonas soli]
MTRRADQAIEGMRISPGDWRYRLKQLGWAAAFLATLAAILFPVILISVRYDHAVSLYEQGAVIACATAAIQMLRRKPVWEVTGRPDRRWLRELGLGGMLGAALMLAPALLLWAGGWVRFHGSDSAIGAVFGVTLLMAGVAVAEELLFRGLLFQRLIGALGVWPAQLILAGLFLLTHLGNPGMTGATRIWAGTNIFLASLLFGMAYLGTRSLAMPIGLHFAANVTQGILLGFGVSGESEPRLLRPVLSAAPDWLTGGAFGLEASLPGLAAVAALLLLLGLRKPSHGGA